MKKLVIVGGGFAGVWAALQASTVRRNAGRERELEITLLSRDPWLTIRPRLYEDSLDGLRVSLDEVLAPVGVGRAEGNVRGIDAELRRITLDGGGVVDYDTLVLATGSAVERASIPGAEHAFTVDTYTEASDLHAHLDGATNTLAATNDRYSAVVIGAGFTGIEVATALVARLRRMAATVGAKHLVRVVLVERSPELVPDLGTSARREVVRALTNLRVEWRTAVAVNAIDAGGVHLADGERIRAATVVVTGGFRASPLATHLATPRDALGRLRVDSFLRVHGVDRVYAAGDIAHAIADVVGHVAPMSCQCAIPMGEIAGHNAAAALLGLEQRAFNYPHYVTCLDLGEAGALFMEGWDRQVRLTGFWATLLKETINTRLIYPPRVGHQSRPDRALEAA